MRLPLSTGPGRLAALVLVVGVAALIGATVFWFESRSQTNSALAAAEAHFEAATATFVNAEKSCATERSAAIRCLQPKERAWSDAFNQFASVISSVRFSSSQREEATALAGDAHTIAQALLVASRAKSAMAHSQAFVEAQGLLQQFDAAALQLLGRSL